MYFARSCEMFYDSFKKSLKNYDSLVIFHKCVTSVKIVFLVFTAIFLWLCISINDWLSRIISIAKTRDVACSSSNNLAR